MKPEATRGLNATMTVTGKCIGGNLETGENVSVIAITVPYFTVFSLLVLVPLI